MSQARFGVVGLGRVGGGLALQALGKGMAVAGFDVAGASDELTSAGLQEATSLADLVQRLETPRIVLLYIHAGAPVDDLLTELREVCQPGDILVDGGNSYWGDSIRRARELEAARLHFVDLGTSGGVGGARTGACFMAGGAPEAVAALRPILEALAVPGGFVHAGGSGAGHWVKLVHNGIEFGMLQAIGEGVELLERGPMPVDVAATLECYRHGSVIRSWLVDLMAAAYVQEGIGEVPGWIEDTGEVNWLVQDAIQREIATPVITQSVLQLFASRDDARLWARAVALMRLGFGGHKLGPIPELAEERRRMRVGGVCEE